MNEICEFVKVIFETETLPFPAYSPYTVNHTYVFGKVRGLYILKWRGGKQEDSSQRNDHLL